MKKFLLTFSIIIVFPLFFSFTCKANDLSVVKSYFSERNLTLCDAFYDKLDTYWSANQDCDLLCYVNPSSPNEGFCFLASESLLQGYRFYFSPPYWFLGANNTTVTYDQYISSGGREDLTFANDIGSRGFLYLSEYDEAGFPDIDYTEVNYDASVPYPWIDVTYVPQIGMQNVSYRVPYIVNFEGITYEQNVTDLFYYMDGRCWIPRKIKISQNNGFYSYEPEDWVSSPCYAIIDMEDRIVVNSGAGDASFDLSDVTVNGSTPSGTTYAINAWNIWKDLYDANSITYYSDTIPENTNQFQDAVSQFQQLDKDLSWGGRIQLKMCYFYIFNGYVNTGLWTVWDSYTPNTWDVHQYGIMQSSGYKEASGTSYQTDPEQAFEGNDEEEAPLPSNIPTNAVNVTVNMNPQVPNTNNYPTIVSYNHDNMFTLMVDNYNKAQSFFGEFPILFAGALSWIPKEIWSIIAMGFLTAIFVMILKVL